MRKGHAFSLLCFATLSLLYILKSAQAQSKVFDRTGIIAERGYHGSLPEEHIDLFSGNVILRYLDAYLPGPNGLDVRVWRFYNSKILKDRQSGQTASVQAYHQSWVGMGWTMHMGMVHAYSSNNPIIEFPDGRMETAFSDINASGKYITSDFCRYEKGIFPTYIPELYFKNGQIWTFGATATIVRADGSNDLVRLVTRIENAYGHHIDIVYDSGKPTIKTITDSMGRVITFVSSGTPKKLVQVKVQINSTTYRVTNYSVGTFSSGYTKLNSVTPPLMPATTYEYENGSSNQYELKKVYSPYGGSLNYAYANHVFYFNGIWLDSRVVTQKKIIFNAGEPEKVWNYAYPDYNGVTTGTVHIDGPEYDTDISYHGYDADCPWKIGAISQYQRGSGNLSETNEWTSQQISNDSWFVLGTNMGPARGLLPASFSKEHLGAAPTKTEYLYERPGLSRYGQPTTVNYYINGSLNPIAYSHFYYYHEGHQSYVDRYLIDNLGARTDYSSDGIKLKELLNQYYEEDTKWGALKKVDRMKIGYDTLSWNYSYSCSDPSSITTKVDPPGIAEELTYKYRFGIMAEETLPDYTKFTRSINAYDSSITSETTNEGRVTNTFYYDTLGSIVRIDLPDPKNDITYTWRPNGENKILVKQGANTSLENMITYFRDGMGRDLGYTETGGNTVLYYRRELDAENRLVAENKGSIDLNDKYLCEYNDSDDPIRISDPTGNFLNITYSEKARTISDVSNHSIRYEYNHLPGLITAITDQLGHTTDYFYDDIGRLTSVIINGTRTHAFVYDGLDNVLSESHPETGQIIYDYDDSNRLAEKAWGGTVVSYGYDKYNRLRKIEAGNGVSIDETIQYVFENRFREFDKVFSSKEWSREITRDDFGNVTNETITIEGLTPKTISYTYDGNNNLSRVTYPDGNWAEITNNQLNRPKKLAFNNVANVLADSASYGPNKALAGLAIMGNGTQYSANFLSNGALNEASLSKGPASLYNASYSYDHNGNILSISSTAPNPPMGASFEYDPANRLISAVYTSCTVGTYTYSYDDYGNMRTVQENGITVFDKSYDTNNRISGAVYDTRGNLITEGGNIHYWDRWNRLEYLTGPAGEVLGSYTYDDRRFRLSAIPPLPEINITVDSNTVPDGGEVIFEAPVGGPPVQKSFIIENEGLANLLLDGSPIITILPNADEFSVVQQPTSPILPSGNSTFVIEFHPTSPGTKTAYISIANNDLSENPFDITLTGNLGPEMDVLLIPNGGSWDFGEVQIGQSTESDFVIENTGRADLLLTGFPKVQINGDEFGQFSVRRQPDSPIPGGEFTYFVIRYSPVNEGPATAEVSIENNDLDENPYTFTITGTGLGGRDGASDGSEIDVMEPDGDEVLVAGETRTISWTGGKDAQFVRIEYSIDNGSTYAMIAERAPNTGAFDWIVPPGYSPVCLIRISDADGIPPAPSLFSLDFDLKLGPQATAGSENVPITIRLALPDAAGQTTHSADLAILCSGADRTEALRLNLAESAPLELGSFSGEWRHIQLVLNMESYTGSVVVDGQPVLDAVPLFQLPAVTDQPQVDISCTDVSSMKVWLENLELRYQDRVQALGENGGTLLRPLLRDAFDRYAAGVFPQYGGWLFNLLAADGSLLPAGQAAGQVLDQGAAQLGEAAEIDEVECLSPTRSFRFERLDTGSFTVVKRFAMPARLPYALSQASFSIISEETKLLQIKQRIDSEKKESTRSPGTDAREGATTAAAGTSGGAPARALLSTRSGTYYIYSYDGRLLATYDLFGNCLTDFIYFDGRILAEFRPSSGELYYYTLDHLGSTRTVTDFSGTVVYSAAFNAYGGLQKIWIDDFAPLLKYAGKERDDESGMYYYGARYYGNSLFRWMSPDPLPPTQDYDPGSLNLYAFTENNPINTVDIFGLWTYGGNPTEKQRRAFCALVDWLKANFPELGSIFTSEGDPSDGIVVWFNDLPSDTPMQERPDWQPSVDGMNLTFKLTVDPDELRGTNQEYQIDIAHEAKHIWNYQAFADAVRKYSADNPKAFDDVNITNKEDERLAYMVSVEAAGMLGKKEYYVGAYNFMGKRPGSFDGRAFDEWARRQDQTWMARKLGQR